MKNKQVVLHVSDWNCNDRYYEMPMDMLNHFKDLYKKSGLDEAWDWMMTATNFGDEPDKPIKYGTVNMTLDNFFLNWIDPAESISEWENNQ